MFVSLEMTKLWTFEK